jgi:hypothetical protein
VNSEPFILVPLPNHRDLTARGTSAFSRGFDYFLEMPAMDPEGIKNLSEAFARICAGGFFLYKMLSGYLISNLILSLACDRKPTDVGADFLVVRTTLKKGDRGAVALHDVIAQVSPAAPGEDQPKPLCRHQASELRSIRP